jgi:hypothetical protein
MNLRLGWTQRVVHYIFLRMMIDDFFLAQAAAKAANVLANCHT